MQYRLFNYGGSLTDNGLALGQIPSGFNSSNLLIQTITPQQVSLDNRLTINNASLLDNAGTVAEVISTGGAANLIDRPDGQITGSVEFGDFANSAPTFCRQPDRR